MRKKYIFAALTGAIAMLTGCTDEFGQQFTPANTGDYIVFGGRAGFQMDDKESKTRTIYTGDFYTVGTGTDAKKYERVHWVAGDKVSIYCDEASGPKSVDYKVTAENTGVDANESGNYHDTGLIPSESENGLQWGNTSTDHTFYAVYPNTGITYNSSEASATVTATLPDIQTPEEITYSDGKWVAKPNMDYAYMIAKTTVNPEESGNSVNLQFMPLVTAVEITLTNLAQETKITNGIEGKVGYNFNLANVIITTTDKSPIYGEFSLDIADMADSDNDGIADAIPTVTNNSAASTNYAITIPMYNDADGDGTNSPALLKYGESLTFTVFMLHNADLNSLNVTIQGVQGTKTGAIGGSGFKIQKNKKTYLRNLPLTDDILPFNQSNWIKYLEDNAIVRTLSIPGAGGAASGYKSTTTTTDEEGNEIQTTGYTVPDRYRQQDLTIAELWDKGVRCFEFTVDITKTSIADEPIYCNTKPTGQTFGTAVNAVKEQLLAHPDEFAMVIVTYQSQTGFGQSRDPETFMSKLSTFWDGLGSDWTATDGSGKVIKGPALYTPSTATVGASRGKFYCIARPTSAYEDDGPTITAKGSMSIWASYVRSVTYDNTKLKVSTTNSNILVINGWGALKDKWEARGYTSCIYHRGTGNDRLNDYIAKGGSADAIGYVASLKGRPFDITTESTISTITTNSAYTAAGGANFYYGTQAGASSTIAQNTAWVQEWARVSSKEKAFSATNEDGGTSTYFWAPTMEEKKLRIQECLSYSMDPTIKGDIVYINSLCGFYVIENELNSFVPNTHTDRNGHNEYLGSYYPYFFPTPLSTGLATSGMSGDIENFAKDINQFFYDHIMTIGDENGYQAGSMGIVLMDRVSSDVNSVGSKIPGIIVANNFQTTQVSTASEAYQIPTAEYNGEPVAAPKRRGANDESEEMSITWE